MILKNIRPALFPVFFNAPPLNGENETLMENKNHPFIANNDGERGPVFSKERSFPAPREKREGEGTLPPSAGGVSRPREPTPISDQTFPQAHIVREGEGKGRNGEIFPFAGHPSTLSCGTFRPFFPDGHVHMFYDGVPDDCWWTAEKPSREGWPSHNSKEEIPMTNPSVRKNFGHGCQHRRLLPYRTIWLFWVVLFPLISGCGVGGGGSGAVGPHETAYVLAQSCNACNGSVIPYAFNSTNGTFYSGSGSNIAMRSTNGTPVQLLFSTGGGHLFVLNSTASGSSTGGSVVSFAVSSATGALSSSPVSTFNTGSNSSYMALSSDGSYLVVANNGTGNNGSVQIVHVSGGSLSQTPTASFSPSSCPNPFRVVFVPGSSSTFYVACSTLPSQTSSNVQGPYSLYSCQISGNCQSTPFFSSSDGYWTSLTIDPSKNYLVGVGTTTSSSGFLVVCPATSPTNTSCKQVTTPNVPYPSGNIAFFSPASGTEQVFIGNYLLGQSATSDYSSCTVTTNPPSCQGSTYSAYSTNSSNPPYGPLFLLGAGSQIFIAATVQTLTTTPSSSPGYLLACPISTTSTPSTLDTCTPNATSPDPVWITLDPSNNYLFVATLSGELDVFEGVSTGNLSFASSSSLSGLQAISVTFQPQS